MLRECCVSESREPSTSRVRVVCRASPIITQLRDASRLECEFDIVLMQCLPSVAKSMSRLGLICADLLISGELIVVVHDKSQSTTRYSV